MEGQPIVNRSREGRECTGDARLHGIAREHWNVLYRILQGQEGLRWVKLFGSRARGDYRSASDIDLAFSGVAGIQSRLAAAFEESCLPYTFDLVDYDRQSNPALKRAIDAEGRLLFRAGEGAFAMTQEQVRLKWEDYHRAVQRLGVALTRDIEQDDVYLDAAIQRFEFSFELGWKLMRALLLLEGVEANSPRSSIREAWKQGIVADAEAWLSMLEARSLSAHTYNEKTAREIHHAIQTTHFALLSDLDEAVKHRMEAEI